MIEARNEINSSPIDFVCRLARMGGSLPSGWMRRILLFLVLITGVLLIAMYAHAPPLASLQPFTTRRVFQSPWSWTCVAGRCERRAVRSSRISLATCTALCGGNTRLLWPRPTGNIILGDESVTMHLQQIEFVTVNTSDRDVKTLLEYAKDVFLGNVRSLIRVANVKGRSGIDSFLIYLSAGNSRGTKLTIDTDESYTLELILKGRQFFGINQLKRLIDGMAASKLNTFHWHLTDSQSFPFDSVQFPEMARWGAYSGDQVYTPDDVKDLADYARIRGVRVLVEIDSPAHAGAGWQWGTEHGYGELALCVDQQPWTSYCGEPNCGQLNPINEHSYRILEGLYRELLDLTEVRDIIHLGGDEVNLDCWAQYGNITAAMQAQNMTDHHAMWAEFETKMFQRLVKANHDEVPKAVILWSSPLTKRPYITTYFDPKIHVIQSWGGSNWLETSDLLEDGFRVILSHVDAWYLDCGFGRWRETGEAACGEYRTWQTVYNHRPWKEYPQQQMNLILGGEAAIWSEQMGQASLGPRVWPRASALAERLW
uniref:beta-N-acetylhexosaminidase n=1 Tax=Vespula pensylvanica TaxID=30213 RepID=A0A834P9S9_VESPE|nr:hypothetical protein H0235_002535 [Vespula pensylvanica]